jgi:hypothetical protein
LYALITLYYHINWHISHNIENKILGVEAWVLAGMQQALPHKPGFLERKNTMNKQINLKIDGNIKILIQKNLECIFF